MHMYADFRLREQVIPLVFVRFPVSVLMPAKFFAKAEDVGRVFFCIMAIRFSARCLSVWLICSSFFLIFPE